MAISWLATATQLDDEFVFAPERYSAKRFALSIEVHDTVPLTDIARLTRSTVNPSHREIAEKDFIVFDTTHAVGGKILFNGLPVKGRDVGSVKRPLRAGNVIVSRLRTYLRQIALIDDELLSRYAAEAVCSTEFYILEPLQPNQDIGFLVPYLLSQSIQEIFENSQEGGHHPRMHQSILTELRIPKALLERSEQVSDQVRHFISAIRKGEAIFKRCADDVADLI